MKKESPRTRGLRKIGIGLGLEYKELLKMADDDLERVCILTAQMLVIERGDALKQVEHLKSVKRRELSSTISQLSNLLEDLA